MLNWVVSKYFSFHFLCDGLCLFARTTLYVLLNLILPLLQVILLRSSYSSTPCNYANYFTVLCQLCLTFYTNELLNELMSYELCNIVHYCRISRLEPKPNKFFPFSFRQDTARALNQEKKHIYNKVLTRDFLMLLTFQGNGQL